MPSPVTEPLSPPFPMAKGWWPTRWEAGGLSKPLSLPCGEPRVPICMNMNCDYFGKAPPSKSFLSRILPIVPHFLYTE